MLVRPGSVRGLSIGLLNSRSPSLPTPPLLFSGQAGMSRLYYRKITMRRECSAGRRPRAIGEQPAYARDERRRVVGFAEALVGLEPGHDVRPIAGGEQDAKRRPQPLGAPRQLHAA